MRKAEVYVQGVLAGILEETDDKKFIFSYDDKYSGPPVSLTMPTSQRVFVFDKFPPFFEGLLPEGAQLAGLLRAAKLDRYDYFSQLVTVGADLVGDVTVKAFK